MSWIGRDSDVVFSVMISDIIPLLFFNIKNGTPRTTRTPLSEYYFFENRGETYHYLYKIILAYIYIKVNIILYMF
jgi:hypothetical protein